MALKDEAAKIKQRQELKKIQTNNAGSNANPAGSLEKLEMAELKEQQEKEEDFDLRAGDYEKFDKNRDLVRRTPRKFDEVLGRTGHGTWNNPEYFSLNHKTDGVQEAPPTILSK